MAKRTLSAHKLSFHVRQHPDEKRRPTDLDGIDLIDAFTSWCGGGPNRNDPERKAWFDVRDVLRVGRRVVLVDLYVGSYGEPGELVDTTRGVVTHQIEANEAPTGRVRVALFVPETGFDSIYFSERSSRGSAGTAFLSNFEDYWRREHRATVIRRYAILEGEAWTHGGQLRGIEVRVFGQGADLADGPSERDAYWTHSVVAKRKHDLPWGYLDRLRSDERFTTKVVGMDDRSLPSQYQVFVTVKGRDGRQKKYELGYDDGPPMREVLNDDNEPELTDDEFLAKCAENVSDLLDRLGGEWKPEWNVPPEG